MSGFKIHVTTQGREALPNADNTGTVAVTVASVGITSQAFDDSSSPATLPGEIKRLTTFSGVAVAADTIHITIRDDSADVYDMRGFGIYLADGTLAACYSQEDVIIGKSALTMLLLSTDIRFVDVDATSIVFGDSTWSNPPGSETVAGVLKLSTDAQAIAGSDRATAVPPGALKAALDARLGAGSPSAYIKGLLAAATATAARIALGIKSAALKDEGTGNGLDADTVDGKHAADFAGAAHSHNLPNLGGTLPIAKGGTGATDASGARANLGLGTAAMGNTGSGKGFDADTVDGKHAADFAGAAHSHNLPDLGGTLPIAKGGTGATDASGARANLGLGTAAMGNTGSGKGFDADTVDGKHAADFAGAAHSHNLPDLGGTLPIANGGTGATTAAAARSNLGLGNVDNTSDLAKPISTATQTALNGKQNSLGFAPVNKAGDTVTGLLAFTGSDALDVRRTANRLMVRDDSGKATIDAITNDGSALDVLRFRATSMLFNYQQVWYAGNFNPDSKANLDSPHFTGTPTLSGSGYFQIDDGGSNYVRYGWNADMSINGSAYYKIWHSGNFNPDSKANISGAAFTGAVSSTGQISAAGGFQVSSSRALKTDLRANPYGLDSVLSLETVVGRYREWFNADQRERVFLVAENVAEAVPPAVDAEGIEATPEGADAPQKFASYSPEQLLPVLVKAIQDLHAIVQAQGERIAELEKNQ